MEERVLHKQTMNQVTYSLFPASYFFYSCFLRKKIYDCLIFFLFHCKYFAAVCIIGGLLKIKQTIILKGHSFKNNQLVV